MLQALMTITLGEGIAILLLVIILVKVCKR